MNDLNLILKTRFGSHLYGTDTPNSDLDYKGVYLAPIENIILGKIKETVYFNTKVRKSEGERNTKDDIDFEVIELRKFIKDALAGQTYALDLLFTPLDFVEQYTEIWKYITDHKVSLLSKHMEPYIGYCRHQAAKYGLKGSRLGDVMKVVEYLKKFDGKSLLGETMKDFKQTEFVKIIDHKVRVNRGWVDQKWWDIVGKKFSMNTQIHYVIESEEIFMNTYGERARLAQKNEGIDWKAISHAYRCMFQLEEIAETGHLVFPLKQADRLKYIKAGNVPYSQVQDELPVLINIVTEKVNNSKFLTEHPDYKFWDEFLIKTYTV